MPQINEKQYHVMPLGNGRMTAICLELLAQVFNEADELAGYALVALLPGIR